jgi:hypothetical protein
MALATRPPRNSQGTRRIPIASASCIMCLWQAQLQARFPCTWHPPQVRPGGPWGHGQHHGREPSHPHLGQDRPLLQARGLHRQQASGSCAGQQGAAADHHHGEQTQLGDQMLQLQYLQRVSLPILFTDPLHCLVTAGLQLGSLRENVTSRICRCMECWATSPQRRLPPCSCTLGLASCTPGSPWWRRPSSTRCFGPIQACSLAPQATRALRFCRPVRLRQCIALCAAASVCRPYIDQSSTCAPLVQCQRTRRPCRHPHPLRGPCRPWPPE